MNYFYRERGLDSSRFTFFWARTRKKLNFQTQTGVFFSPVFGTFCVHDQIKYQDFSYLSVTFKKKVNTKLFLIVFHYIVVFRFEVKQKPALKLNLDRETRNRFEYALFRRNVNTTRSALASFALIEFSTFLPSVFLQSFICSIDSSGTQLQSIVFLKVKK